MLPGGVPGCRGKVKAGAVMGEPVQGGSGDRGGPELRALRRLAAGDPQGRQVLQHPPHGGVRAPGWYQHSIVLAWIVAKVFVWTCYH